MYHVIVEHAVTKAVWTKLNKVKLVHYIFINGINAIM
jgi:hypothetical protein